MPLAALTDEEALPEPNGSQSDRKTSLSVNTLDILSVNELLDSVRCPFFFLCIFFQFHFAESKLT